jgi:[glutamine synthetase] adenylyltransferase / [glutamine synthetase]-adenylyl-L-tyrosine phosphorylase
MRPEFSGIAFENSAKAEQNLARLEQQLAPTLLAPLASLLAHSPDPDGALNLLERYVEGASPEVLAGMARTPTALTYLIAIFGYSGFLAETLLAEPDLVVQFARDRHFTKLKSKEEVMQDYARFSTTSPDHWLSAQLSRFKRRNYLRIVLKDVLRLSTLGETTLELSTLADVILANALSFCYQELDKRYGHPQYRDAQGRIVRSGFSIISLGKLGGNELNYSSDIDLLFLYGQDGETSGGNEQDSMISNKEFFVRLAHAITRTITQSTHQGEVFRVDLRLRPEGEQGDLAISLNSAAEYYEHRARDWELQMLIKARHSAGEPRLTREFLRRVENYIYGTPADFEAVESILLARERISKKLRESRDDSPDVKLHRGGIRDIEFLTQCLQRLHGGRDPWVRSGGTLFALRKLNDKGWLPDEDFAALTSCYEFFRQVEHRIQLEMGKQSHRLPASPEALVRLARRLEMDAGPRGDARRALLTEIDQRFERVERIYERLIHSSAKPPEDGAFVLVAPTAGGADLSAGSLESVLRYLDAHAAEISAAVRGMTLTERTRRSVARFLGAMLSSSEQFRAALLSTRKLKMALEVVSASEYLGDLLIHHPEDLEALEPVGKLAAPSGQLEIALGTGGETAPYLWSREENVEFREKMALLRREYRARSLALAAADITEWTTVSPALARWSALARRAISTALEIAAREAGDGLPREPERMPFAVVALGRLGLNEFDLASDADLVFVAAEGTSREDVARWTRLAEKIIEVLSSYTRDGSLFVVDTRLRPRGQEGELVVTENGLLTYLTEASQPWEVMTYLKASHVAGNVSLGKRVVAGATARCFERFTTFPDVEGELHRMRRRLEKEVIVPPSNTKTAPGGYYDVDYAVSYLRLGKRLSLSPGAQMAEQIGALNDAGLIEENDSRALLEGAALLRSLDHAMRLATGKAAEGLPEHVGHAEAVENLAKRWGLIKQNEILARRVRDVQQNIRYVYRRLVNTE